jgi:nucleotide-binding universal stress UspA family protein
MPVLAQIHEQKRSIEFKRILIATDFSQASRRALSFGLAIARRYNSTLTVLHAVPPEPREPLPMEHLPLQLNRGLAEAEQRMKQLGEEVRFRDCTQRLVVDQGQVCDVIASAIERDNIDVLVLGTHGRGGLMKAVLGSVAEQVLRLAECPVLTVGPHVAPCASEQVEFQRILFATDFGAPANKALPYAITLAEDHQAKLVMLHMVPPLSAADLGPAVYGPYACLAEELIDCQCKMREKSISKLKNLIPANAKLASEPEYVAGLDFLPEGILEVAWSRKIDLIVMGANRTGSPRLAAHTPWAVTHDVICRAKCPVLTVSS